MRSLKILIIVILLMGCASNSAAAIKEDVSKTIEKVNETKAYENHNHNKGLFSYYLPKNIGVLRSNKISTVMLVDDYEVFMALNVSEIMNNKIDEFNVEASDFILVNEFITLDNKNVEVNNKVVIEQLGENQYLLYLKVNEIFFVTSVPSAAISTMLENMLIVSRTINIDRNLVVAEFSNKEEMNYQKQVIELFSESVPEEGFIKDIYESDKEDD